jgi:hypothetical protein
METDMAAVAEMAGQVARTLAARQETRRREAAALFCLVCGPEWSEWWATVIQLLDGIPRTLGDDLNRVLDSMDARTAQAKDIGAFAAPDRYLVKRATEEMRKRGLKWPPFPPSTGLAGPSAAKRGVGDTVAPPNRQRRF